MLIKPARSGLAASALIALSMLTSCARAPSRPATAFEQVLAYNASLALSNETLVKVVIEANRDSLLTTEQTTFVLNAQYLIAKQDKELTAILQGGPELAKKDATYIQAYIESIIAAVDRQINSGLIPPKVRPVLDTIKFFAQLIISDLKLLHILN